ERQIAGPGVGFSHLSRQADETRCKDGGLPAPSAEVPPLQFGQRASANRPRPRIASSIIDSNLPAEVHSNPQTVKWWRSSADFRAAIPARMSAQGTMLTFPGLRKSVRPLTIKEY